MLLQHTWQDLARRGLMYAPDAVGTNPLQPLQLLHKLVYSLLLGQEYHTMWLLLASLEAWKHYFKLRSFMLYL